MKTVYDLREMKAKGEKVAWITAYDYPSAYCAEKAGIDMILVGDSGGMTVLGYPSTHPVTMDDMIVLAKAARRGAPNTFIIGDMPLGTYEESTEKAVYNAMRFIKESGCNAIKLEGSSSNVLQSVRAIVGAGIVVFGHLGLTPQSAGAYKVQGKTISEMRVISDQARLLFEAGASFLLLEAMPEESASCVANCGIMIPCYGIGAGAKLDGQLLIYHDVMGYYPNFKPRFAKNYVERIPATDGIVNNGFIGLAVRALQDYISEVKSGLFPSLEYIYPMKDESFIKYVTDSKQFYQISEDSKS